MKELGETAHAAPKGKREKLSGERTSSGRNSGKRSAADAAGAPKK